MRTGIYGITIGISNSEDLDLLHYLEFCCYVIDRRARDFRRLASKMSLFPRLIDESNPQTLRNHGIFYQIR
jgi:hypothetical protein